MDSIVVKIEDLQQQQDIKLLQKNDNLLLNQVKNEIADQVTSFPVANKVASQTTELVVVEKTFKCESNTDLCNDLSTNNNEFLTNIAIKEQTSSVSASDIKSTSIPRVNFYSKPSKTSNQRDASTRFECDVCSKKFSQKDYLKIHKNFSNVTFVARGFLLEVV